MLFFIFFSFYDECIIHCTRNVYVCNFEYIDEVTESYLIQIDLNRCMERYKRKCEIKPVTIIAIVFGRLTSTLKDAFHFTGGFIVLCVYDKVSEHIC